MCSLVAMGDRDILWFIDHVCWCLCMFIWLKCVYNLVDRFIGPLLFEALQ